MPRSHPRALYRWGSGLHVDAISSIYWEFSLFFLYHALVAFYFYFFVPSCRAPSPEHVYIIPGMCLLVDHGVCVIEGGEVWSLRVDSLELRLRSSYMCLCGLM